MAIRRPWRRVAPLLFAVLGLSLVAAVAAACGGGEEEEATPTGTRAATVVATATPAATRVTTPAATPEEHEEGLSLDGASAAITVDGDDSDWSGIKGLTVRLEQITVPPGADIEFDPVDPIDATLKVATDEDNIYVLLAVPDDYDFDPADHNLSASPNVMFRIERPASPHMGAEEPEFETSLGTVDIWHWELDCGPGEMSGGVTGMSGGDDPDCNLDDEYATTPEDREDDDSVQAENSLSGVWDHTGRAQGAGADGTWVFEFSRPLQTGDPQDAQFTSGGKAFMALAYFDPDESATGWSDAGHLTSAESGWIEVNLP